MTFRQNLSIIILLYTLQINGKHKGNIFNFKLLRSTILKNQILYIIERKYGFRKYREHNNAFYTDIYCGMEIPYIT